MWLADGRVLQDLLGDWYTLLDLAGSCETEALEKAFRALGAPLEVLRLDELDLREVYSCSVLLLRPDLHIAWRGNALPKDPTPLANLATGHLSSWCILSGRAIRKQQIIAVACVAPNLSSPPVVS